jgi:hypothetical protein
MFVWPKLLVFGAMRRLVAELNFLQFSTLAGIGVREVWLITVFVECIAIE